MRSPSIEKRFPAEDPHARSRCMVSLNRASTIVANVSTMARATFSWAFPCQSFSEAGRNKAQAALRRTSARRQSGIFFAPRRRHTAQCPSVIALQSAGSNTALSETAIASVPADRFIARHRSPRRSACTGTWALSGGRSASRRALSRQPGEPEYGHERRGIRGGTHGKAGRVDGRGGIVCARGMLRRRPVGQRSMRPGADQQAAQRICVGCAYQFFASQSRLG
jgi:hypothetical protein